MLAELQEQFRHLTDEQKIVLLLDEVDGLYQNGQTARARELLSRFRQRMELVEAWCLYREKKYAECHEVLSQVPESTKSLELWAYLYAYTPSGFRDEQKLLATVAKLPFDNFNRTNALVIAAREKGSTLDADPILSGLTPWIASFDRSLATVEQSNLLHNAARLALEKGNLPRALEIIDYAIEAYSTRTNWHHRGAANYWKSVILEKMDKPYQAWQAGQESLRCWETQLDLEPNHPDWPTRARGARERAASLQKLLVERENALELIQSATQSELETTDTLTVENYHHRAAAYELRTEILLNQNQNYEAWQASLEALKWRVAQLAAEEKQGRNPTWLTDAVERAKAQERQIKPF